MPVARIMSVHGCLDELASIPPNDTINLLTSETLLFQDLDGVLFKSYNPTSGDCVVGGRRGPQGTFFSGQGGRLSQKVSSCLTHAQPRKIKGVIRACK